MTRRQFLGVAAGGLLLAGVGCTASQPRPDGLDVLVIGSGPAGLAAAWEAARLGASVRVLEQASYAGGAGWYVKVFYGVATRWQSQVGLADDLPQAQEDWRAFTDGGVGTDPQVTTLLRRSAETLDWITAELGCHCPGLIHSDPSPGAMRRLHLISGQEVMQRLVASMEGRISTGCRVESLIVEDGQVAGARYAGPQGGGVLRARATILATGGFARDRARVVRDQPALSGLAFVHESAPTSTGGGLALLDQVGAPLQNRGHLGIYVHAVADYRRGGRGEALVLPDLASSLIVDLKGRRVANEQDTFGFGMFKHLAAAPSRRLLAVFPQDRFATLRALELPFRGSAQPFVGGAELLGAGAGRSFAGVEKLAEAYRIDAGTLSETLTRYQAVSATGSDADFEKRREFLEPFGPGRLAVVELVPGPSKAFTGAMLDADGRVLDARGEPVAGLYAAGEAAGMLGTPAVGAGFQGAVTACFLTGRIAGRSAALASRR